MNHKVNIPRVQYVCVSVLVLCVMCALRAVVIKVSMMYSGFILNFSSSEFSLHNQLLAQKVFVSPVSVSLCLFMFLYIKCYVC